MDQLYEIVYKYNNTTSWLYFTSTPEKYKAAGERRFRAVVRDYGLKGAKLVKIQERPNAKDPPLTIKQNEPPESKPKRKPRRTKK